MVKEVIRIGTRGSKLALWQANYVAELIRKRYPFVKVELVIVKTKGDKILDVPLAKIGGKGLFVKEIEDKILSKEIDLAVHSMKDVPVELPKGLKVGIVPKSEDPCDCFVSERFSSIYDLPKGSVIGTSSLRRRVQIKHLREDLKIEPLRGNLDTRIKKLKDGKFDAIIVAFAGIKRLGICPKFLEKFDPKVFIPAVGQGALGIEYREEDKELESFLSFLDDPKTKYRVLAERSFLKKLQGGCQVPMGCYAYLKDSTLEIIGFLSSTDGKTKIVSQRQGPFDQYKSLGEELAEDILKRGGEKILKKIYQSEGI